jgi:hypothetical protein
MTCLKEFKVRTPLLSLLMLVAHCTHGRTTSATHRTARASAQHPIRVHCSVVVCTVTVVEDP